MVYEILNKFGEVINTIVADEDFVKKHYPNQYRLRSYNYYDEAHKNPPILSKIAMISRFTDNEYADILSAAKSDIAVEAWLDRFRAANVIDLNDDRTISGIHLMVNKNLLSTSRSQEILSTPVQDEEKP